MTLISRDGYYFTSFVVNKLRFLTICPLTRSRTFQGRFEAWRGDSYLLRRGGLQGVVREWILSWLGTFKDV